MMQNWKDFDQKTNWKIKNFKTGIEKFIISIPNQNYVFRSQLMSAKLN